MPAQRTIVVGQSGGPTAVINCTLAGVIQAAHGHRLLGMRHGIEGLLVNDLVDLSRESPASIQRLRRTPSAALGSGRHRLSENDLDQAIDRLREWDVDAFLYAGGNDSADTTHRLADAARHVGLRTTFLGLPKTIDNDLPETDHCPGYGSAARFVAMAALEIGTDTLAMRRTDPVRLIEVMGRDAGWLAATAALARRAPDDAPHLILFPEAPLGAEEIISRTREIHRRLGYAVVVLCENQPGPGGQVLGSNDEPEFVDSYGHAYHPSPASYLARCIRAELGLRARVDPLSRLQRSSIALRSPVDATEAEALGRDSVLLAMSGHTDQMLVLKRLADRPYRFEIGLAPLERIANQQRLLPPEFVDVERGLPTEAFLNYVRPLTGASLPRHQRYI